MQTKCPRSKGPVLVSLGFALWGFINIYLIQILERKTCFEMGESKQSPPGHLHGLIDFSVAIGFNSVFISSGYAESRYSKPMYEWCRSCESCRNNSLLKNQLWNSYESCVGSGMCHAQFPSFTIREFSIIKSFSFLPKSGPPSSVVLCEAAAD